MDRSADFAPNPDIARFKDDKDAAIAFIFDDNNRSDIEITSKMFEDLGWRASFAINDPREWAEDWKALAQRGHEIANHSLNHHHLNKIRDRAKLEHEINENYDLITDVTGRRPLTFVYPFGAHNDEVDQVVFARHLFTRTFPDFFCHPVNYYSDTQLREANGFIIKAIRYHDWLVVAAHGVEDGWFPLKKEFVKEHLEFIKQREDQLWVDTFQNIALYKIEREHSKVSTIVKNDGAYVSVQTNLNYTGEWIPLTIKIRMPSTSTGTLHAQDVYNGKAIEVVKQGEWIYWNMLPNTEVRIASIGDANVLLGGNDRH